MHLNVLDTEAHFQQYERRMKDDETIKNEDSYPLLVHIIKSIPPLDAPLPFCPDWEQLSDEEKKVRVKQRNKEIKDNLCDLSFMTLGYYVSHQLHVRKFSHGLLLDMIEDRHREISLEKLLTLRDWINMSWYPPLKSGETTFIRENLRKELERRIADERKRREKT